MPIKMYVCNAGRKDKITQRLSVYWKAKILASPLPVNFSASDTTEPRTNTISGAGGKITYPTIIYNTFLNGKKQ